ncbi:metallophosphoesterase [Fimbriiglobus ruber]|uniref:Phosphohydrolase (MutT/nudix family protein) n=1 Tax=Fimbriiglobus ruber TaxID=1908690 RepID=A0A225DEA4_9BACT|nr:metallophosphoesterase [Fimbriiglobus ruber]OWK35479.1 Phosphohydrolase (MutT/nudix family protein) [Fimbriiglobus ruber]
MSEVYFIADSHFGHCGIIQFSETKPFRPFTTIEEHDAELVRRWNSVVGPKDMVWHLGDFCFGKRNLEIAAQLNGNKKLVMGNHDMYATEDYLRYFTRLSGAVEYKGMILTHVPVHESQLARWYMNVHGHLHTKRVMRDRCHFGVLATTEPDPRFVCVSAEQIDLTPAPFDWILNKWAERNL